MDTKNTLRETKSCNVHFVTGSDEFEVMRAAQEFAFKLAPPDIGDFGIEIIEAPSNIIEACVGQVKKTIQAIMTFPFCGKKLVWMKGVMFLKDTVQGRSQEIQEALDSLLLSLEKGLPHGINLLISAPEADKRRSFYKKLSELAITTVCDKVDFGFGSKEQDIIDWIADRFRNQNVTIEKQATILLSSRVGANSGQIDAELTKLVTAAGKGANITEKLIRDLVPLSRVAGIFELSDAINKRNLSLALDVFSQLRSQGESSMGILLAAILPTVRNLLIVKDLIDLHKMKTPIYPQVFIAELKRLATEKTYHLPRKKDGMLNTYAMTLAGVNAAQFEKNHLMHSFLACCHVNEALIKGYTSENILLTQLLVRIIGKSTSENHTPSL